MKTKIPFCNFNLIHRVIRGNHELYFQIIQGTLSKLLIFTTWNARRHFVYTSCTLQIGLINYLEIYPTSVLSSDFLFKIAAHSISCILSCLASILSRSIKNCAKKARNTRNACALNNCILFSHSLASGIVINFVSLSLFLHTPFCFYFSWPRPPYFTFSFSIPDHALLSFPFSFLTTPFCHFFFFSGPRHSSFHFSYIFSDQCFCLSHFLSLIQPTPFWLSLFFLFLKPCLPPFSFPGHALLFHIFRQCPSDLPFLFSFHAMAFHLRLLRSPSPYFSLHLSFPFTSLSLVLLLCNSLSKGKRGRGEEQSEGKCESKWEKGVTQKRERKC